VICFLLWELGTKGIRAASVTTQEESTEQGGFLPRWNLAGFFQNFLARLNKCCVGSPWYQGEEDAVESLQVFSCPQSFLPVLRVISYKLSKGLCCQWRKGIFV
jgi:hypothetical protein